MAFFWKREPIQWDPARATPPWGSRPSIFDHIRDHIAVGKRGLSEGGQTLPDEDRLPPGSLRWIAGGLDGALGHHGVARADDKARAIQEALSTVLGDATTSKLTKLYELLREGTLEYVDSFLQSLPSRHDLDLGRLAVLAEWIARHAPDREPVKFAIATLGAVSGHQQEDLFLTLGRHEEFTLYATIALSNSSLDADRVLYELAQNVKGWGRIQVVERLAKTTDPSIKRWLLREGYKNSIMHEYLAYTCATAGGLLSELDADTIDKELLAATGEMIQALIAGGPAQDMHDYADGALVAERYLHHLGPNPSKLDQLLAIDAIKTFVGRDRPWDDSDGRAWTKERRAALRARCEALEALPHWKHSVASGLESADADVFSLADAAARISGIDTWEKHYQRVEAGQGGWYFVMQTNDPVRIDRVIALAEQRIPLETIATGPADEIGLGPEWSAHGHLDLVLQGLSDFPEKGWTLIRAGLRSPVVRNRHMALRALSRWEKSRWPSDAESRLRNALELEMDERVLKEIRTALEGKAIP